MIFSIILTFCRRRKCRELDWTSGGEVSRGRIRVATFRCPEFALVLFKSIFVEPLESFVLLCVRLVFKTRRVDRFSTFSASPRRAYNEKKRRVIFFHYFDCSRICEVTPLAGRVRKDRRISRRKSYCKGGVSRGREERHRRKVCSIRKR